MNPSSQRAAIQRYPSLVMVPFSHWQQNQRKGILFSQLQKKPLFWNQSLTIMALFKPVEMYHSHNGYVNTGWQITVDLQMTPSKFSVMALIKLRWTLSFTDWHRYANDLYGIWCPFFFVLFAYTTLCILLESDPGFWMSITALSVNAGTIKGWENITISLWHQPRLAPVKCR